MSCTSHKLFAEALWSCCALLSSVHQRRDIQKPSMYGQTLIVSNTRGLWRAKAAVVHVLLPYCSFVTPVSRANSESILRSIPQSCRSRHQSRVHARQLQQLPVTCRKNPLSATAFGAMVPVIPPTRQAQRHAPPKHQRRHPARVQTEDILGSSFVPVFYACMATGLILSFWVAYATLKLNYSQVILTSIQLLPQLPLMSSIPAVQSMWQHISAGAAMQCLRRTVENARGKHRTLLMHAVFAAPFCACCCAAAAYAVTAGPDKCIVSFFPRLQPCACSTSN